MSDEYAQPNPLPPTIPPGVAIASETDGVFLETRGTLKLGKDGRYQGAVQLSSPRNSDGPYEQPNRTVRPEHIDWRSYRIATGTT